METDVFPSGDARSGANVKRWKLCCFHLVEEPKENEKGPIFLVLTLALATRPAGARPKYDPGASDTEIKIGNVAPYSGPVSLYGAVGKVEAAFFRMVNDQGGINGRKINFISYDDAYSPPKTLEQTRRLVKSDEILVINSPVGAPTNSAIQKYLNGKKVPHLSLASASTRWDDPQHFPWTMGVGTSYQSEGAIFARYIQREKPDAKIAVLYQNDDFGKDMLKGFLDALGEKSSMIVAKSSYEVSEPTIDSHIVTLKSSGADVLVAFATPKFAVQTIKKVSEIGWKPLHIVTSVSSSVGAVLAPAGFENAQGLVSATYLKDVLDPNLSQDPGMNRFLSFLQTYMPGVDKTDSLLILGYSKAEALAHVLREAGDDLTRENIMKLGASLQGVKSDVLLDGITLNTTPDNYSPEMRMMRFKGERWELFGDLQKGIRR
jgi:branched-chain amino acid transport system substrate-binding protein